MKQITMDWETYQSESNKTKEEAREIVLMMLMEAVEKKCFSDSPIFFGNCAQERWIKLMEKIFDKIK